MPALKTITTTIVAGFLNYQGYASLALNLSSSDTRLNRQTLVSENIIRASFWILGTTL